MKFMMMMHAPKGDGSYQITQWTPDAIQSHIGYMKNFNRDLSTSGEFVAAEGLAMPGEAKLVRAAADGTPITDGSFAETKEYLVGFWIIDVESAARAYALAATASAAPGPTGAPLNMNIELRQIMLLRTSDA